MRTTKYIALAVLMSVMAMAADEQQSLQAVIEKSMTPGAGVHDDWLAENIKTWPGLRTTQGVAALYDLWMSTDNGEIRIACHRIEDKLLVPRDQIVTYLLGRVTASETLGQEMINLQLLEHYFDDARVPVCFASYLGDKRVIREGRAYARGSRRRVCDNASTLLLLGYENAGLLKRGEGGIVGDTLCQEHFDQNIAALRPYLIQQGVIAADAPYPPQPGRTRPGGGLATAAAPREHNLPAPSGTGDPADAAPASASAWNWLRWLGLLLAAAALLWLAFSKRKIP